jgi:hypothetical protein
MALRPRCLAAQGAASRGLDQVARLLRAALGLVQATSTLAV